MNEEKVKINEEKREEYEQLIKDSAPKLDGYWDSSNPIIKIILLILGVLIIGGVFYYIFMFLTK